MDLLPGIPDWLTCGVVIVAGSIGLQLWCTWCERSLRQVSRDVDRWQESQPELAVDDRRKFYRRATSSRNLAN